MDVSTVVVDGSVRKCSVTPQANQTSRDHRGADAHVDCAGALTSDIKFVAAGTAYIECAAAATHAKIVGGITATFATNRAPTLRVDSAAFLVDGSGARVTKEQVTADARVAAAVNIVVSQHVDRAVVHVDICGGCNAIPRSKQSPRRDVERSIVHVDCTGCVAAVADSEIAVGIDAVFPDAGEVHHAAISDIQSSRAVVTHTEFPTLCVKCRTRIRNRQISNRAAFACDMDLTTAYVGPTHTDRHHVIEDAAVGDRHCAGAVLANVRLRTIIAAANHVDGRVRAINRHGSGRSCATRKVKPPVVVHCSAVRDIDRSVSAIVADLNIRALASNSSTLPF